jgi:hypothetical protein
MSEFSNLSAEEIRKAFLEQRGNTEPVSQAKAKGPVTEDDQRAAYAMRGDVREVDSETRAALIRQIQRALTEINS